MLKYIKLLRPRQITKNAFCLAGALFSGEFVHLKSDIAALKTLLAFCAASSAVYIFNDVLDRERDRLHPRKRYRPIASGAVSVPQAIVLGLLLVCVGISIAYTVGNAVMGCLIIYLVNNVFYSWRLKHVALFDVLCIAFGFVLRMLAGVYAVGDLPTTWITLCTFFLASFLGFSKRRAEFGQIVSTREEAQRPVLTHYTLRFLEYLVNSTADMTVICYSLFTVASNKNPSLVMTVPLVFFSVTHFKRLVLIMDKGEEPEKIVIRDPLLLASVVLWLATYIGIIYGNVRLFR
jgi:4-hydroxybenzoate polyprenyltransferase